MTLKIVTGRQVELTDKKLTTGQFRISYPNLNKPRGNKKKPEQEKKYSIAMIFSKDDNLSQLEIAAHNAAVEKWGPDKKAWPSKKIRSKKTGNIISKCIVEMPFKDGDILMPDKEEYANAIFFNASRREEKGAPAQFDQHKKPITTIKAGDYCRASLIANAFDVDGNYGVSFSLLGVQLLKTGEALGGGNAANDFDEVEMEVEDMEGSEESEDEVEY